MGKYMKLLFVIVLVGHFSQANSGVLEQVAERRIANGWGLEEVKEGHILIATPQCHWLGHEATVIVGSKRYRATVVDCSHNSNAMIQRGLVADTNTHELVHQEAQVIFTLEY